MSSNIYLVMKLLYVPTRRIHEYIFYITMVATVVTKFIGQCKVHKSQA